MIPPADSSGYPRSSRTSASSSSSMRARISSRLSSERSATRSAASSGLISSRTSAARSGARSSRTSTWASGSISSIASATISTSIDGEDAGAVARRQLLEDRREVRRVQLREALVRHAEADAGDRGLDRVHVLPVDVAVLDRQLEVARDDAERALDPEAAQQAGRADVHGDEPEGALDLVEADVVHADDLAAVDVHDLLVEQVGLQEDLVLALVELPDVDRRGVQARADVVEALDGRPRDEDPALLGLDDEPGDGRVPVADRHDQVGHRPDGLAGPVEHRPADGPAQVDHLPPRRAGPQPTAGRWRGTPGVPRPLRGRGGPRGSSRRVSRRGYWVRSPLGECSSDPVMADPAARARADRGGAAATSTGRSAAPHGTGPSLCPRNGSRQTARDRP